MKRHGNLSSFDLLAVMLRVFLLQYCIFTASQAQEAPFVDFPKFSQADESFRTNVCDRQARVFRQELNLRDALRGLNLTVAITDYTGWNEENFFGLNDEGTIRPDDPGLFAEILDELAQRAGFTWRNTFAAIKPVTQADNRTWTDLLEWEVENFDIAADYWARSADRMAKGIAYPHGWYDGSIVLAALDPSLVQEKVDLWSFLKPFEISVWIAIVMAIIFTGLAYFVLERLNTASDERQLEDKPVASIFLAAMTFTGHFEYMPDTHASRLLSFSWTFWALIIASAYTANLASFLVSQNEVQKPVGTIDQALQQRVPVCVQRGAIIDDILSEKYPQLLLVRKDSEQEMFQGLRQDWYRGGGGCGVVLTNLGTLQLYQSQRLTNPDCSLSSDKRTVLKLPAGFATAVDAGIHCTSLVSFVLDFHLREMRADDFIDKAWQRHVASQATVDCSAVTGRGGMLGEEDSVSLGPGDMGGIFIAHGMLCILALVAALIEYWSLRKAKINGTPLPKKSRLFDSMRNMPLRNAIPPSSSATLAKELSNILEASEFMEGPEPLPEELATNYRVGDDQRGQHRSAETHTLEKSEEEEVVFFPDDSADAVEQKPSSVDALLTLNRLYQVTGY